MQRCERSNQWELLAQHMRQKTSVASTFTSWLYPKKLKKKEGGVITSTNLALVPDCGEVNGETH